MFCVAPLGRPAAGYEDLADSLGDDQPVYALQATGLSDDEEPHSRVEDMAAHYVKAIRAVQPEGPYFLVGRCFGGIVAFEMAQQISRQNAKAVLIVLDTLWTPRTEFKAGRGLLARLRRRLKRIFKGKGGLARPEELPFLNAVTVAHARALRRYVAETYPGRITLIQSNTGAESRSDARWSALAAEGVDVVRVDARHDLLLRSSHLRATAEVLGDCLRRLQN